MNAITEEVRDRLRGDLAAARAARRSGDRERCWELLEEPPDVGSTEVCFGWLDGSTTRPMV